MTRIDADENHSRFVQPFCYAVQPFCYAMDGFCHALRVERNMKVHYVAANLLLLWVICVRPAAFQGLLTMLACCMVFAAELVNTAIERTVDIAVGKNFHVLAKQAKDLAAAGVLATSLAAVVIGVYVVFTTYPWQWRAFTDIHLFSGVAAACMLVLLWAAGLHARFHTIKQ